MQRARLEPIALAFPRPWLINLSIQNVLKGIWNGECINLNNLAPLCGLTRNRSLLCLRLHHQSIRPGKSVQWFTGEWDICERRLRHLQCTSNTLSSCEGWMSPTNLGANIFAKFALRSGGIDFFFSLLDTTVVNMWKLHSHQSLLLGTKTLSHKSFQLRLAKVLASHHLRSRNCTSRFNRHEALLHMPMWSHLRKVCCECHIRCQTYCPCCLGHHIHIGDCWKAVHRPILD
jgi:hypothetical protein